MKAQYIDIAISKLLNSPTNPRTVILDDDDMQDLSNSIKAHGVIQPLIVRPLSGEFFEIAAGHRRKFAANKAGLKMVPCVVRLLSDVQILDTHINENIHRLGLTAMAEARTYKLARDNGATLASVVERSGKSEGYVTRRLSLNNLIPSFQTDVDGDLPLEYGLELAKYPHELQAEIEKHMYDTCEMYKGVDVSDGYIIFDCPNCKDRHIEAGSYYDPDEGDEKRCEACDVEMEPLDEIDDIETETTIDRTKLCWRVSDIGRWVANNNHDLEKAFFTKEQTDLREDGLACINCPTRTGANAGLFDQTEKDLCLNSKCYEAKNEAFVALTRTRIGETTPIVARHRYGQMLPEGVFSDRECHIIQEDDESCAVTQTIEYLVGQGETEQPEGCLQLSGCTKHHWANRSNNQNGEGDDKGDPEILARVKRLRKEEIWNVKVGEAVRRIVLAESARSFGAKAEGDASKEVFSAVITSATINRMWEIEEQGHKEKVIFPAIKAFLELEELPAFYEDHSWRKEAEDYPRRLTFIDGLSYNQKATLLFLFTYGSEGAMFSGTWKDQDAVKGYAYLFGVNYELIDAKMRVELSTKKHETVHKAYLQQVETNDPKRQIPILFAVEPVKQPDAKPTVEPESVSEAETEQSEPEPEETSPEPSEDEDEDGEWGDDEDEDEEPECDHRDARVCEMSGCPGIPDDTPSLDTSFHDHEMNVGDDLSIYETDPICVAMRNSTLFDESEIEGYHDEELESDSFNSTQQMALRGILTEYASRMANLDEDEEATAGTCLSCGQPTDGAAVCVGCQDEDAVVENTFEEDDEDGISDEDVDELSQAFADKLAEAKAQGEK